MADQFPICRNGCRSAINIDYEAYRAIIITLNEA